VKAFIKLDESIHGVTAFIKLDESIHGVTIPTNDREIPGSIPGR